MRALTWQGIGDVQVREVPDPVIQEPTDAIVRVTATAICGSDLHLYDVLAPFLKSGDVLGHEFMGVVEAVGDGVDGLQPGDRVVVPFCIACGHCWMCRRGLFAQCETTQVTEHDKGARLFGYTSLYGSVPGGQAELVRVPHADFGPVKLPDNFPDERFLFLSDVLPTAWQGVGPNGGAGGQHRGRASAVDERLEYARQWGAEVVDYRQGNDVAAALRELTDGRGPDAVLDAVGMEAHGNPVAGAMIAGAARLPKPVGRQAIDKIGVDRLDALYTAINAVRRGGTVSVSGVYGGAVDPMPLFTMFDKGITVRMGQCHVQRWTDELFDLANQTTDVLGLEDFATHRLPLSEAPDAYEMFRDKRDGCIKVVLHP